MPGAAWPRGWRGPARPAPAPRRVILIPEIPFGYEAVAAGVLSRERRGRRFFIVVVAEGARYPGGRTVVRQIVEDSPEPVRLGGVGAVLARALKALVPFEVRYVALGNVQQGGSPTAFDRVLATRFGTDAVAALAAGTRDAWWPSRADRARPRGRCPLQAQAGGSQGRARDRRPQHQGTIFGDEARASD